MKNLTKLTLLAGLTVVAFNAFALIPPPPPKPTFDFHVANCSPLNVSYDLQASSSSNYGVVKAGAQKSFEGSSYANELVLGNSAEQPCKVHDNGNGNLELTQKAGPLQGFTCVVNGSHVTLVSN